MKYTSMTAAELSVILKEQQQIYDDFVKEKLSVDMSRGKPCAGQLNAMLGFFECCDATKMENSPLLNYGNLEGVPAMRKIFGDMLGVPAKNVLVLSNSSLNIMYDTIQRAMQFGVMGGEPWNKQGGVKFICPSPGYDRHFAICEHFGIEMISVPMGEEGPDMDIIEPMVAADEKIKGIWCVPKYSNPTGVTYSDEVVERIAALETAAKDFRVFWDNAYAVHNLYKEADNLKNIFELIKGTKNEDKVYIFSSTSKITFPGSGCACVAASDSNITDILSHVFYQSICPNKVNQAAHSEFIKNNENLAAIMEKHAAILRPKFMLVEERLQAGLAEFGIAEWSKPKGGYFISFNAMKGTAKKIEQLCKGAGLTLTSAGATYPYGADDFDSNIRIAPTFPTLTDLTTACDIFVCCVKIASIKKLLERID